MCLYGFRTEWAAIGLPHKATHPDAVRTIWNVMTAAPYNVQPGLREYGFLIKSLIVLGKREEAMEYMLELQPHYKHLLADLEEKFYRYLPSTAYGSIITRPAKSGLMSRRTKTRPGTTSSSGCTSCSRRDALKTLTTIWLSA